MGAKLAILASNAFFILSRALHKLNTAALKSAPVFAPFLFRNYANSRQSALSVAYRLRFSVGAGVDSKSAIVCLLDYSGVFARHWVMGICKPALAAISRN
jgi:hypothetical protein